MNTSQQLHDICIWAFRRPVWTTRVQQVHTCKFTNWLIVVILSNVALKNVVQFLRLMACIRTFSWWNFDQNPDCPAFFLGGEGRGDGYLVPQILSTTVTYVRTEPFPVTSFPVYCWLLPVHFILLPITCVIPSWIKQYKNNYGARIVVEFIQDDWHTPAAFRIVSVLKIFKYKSMFYNEEDKSSLKNRNSTNKCFQSIELLVEVQKISLRETYFSSSLLNPEWLCGLSSLNYFTLRGCAAGAWS